VDGPSPVGDGSRQDRSVGAVSVRLGVVAVLGAVLWLTVGWSGLVVLGPVGAVWLLDYGVGAFALGQVLLLFEFSRWLVREAVVIEAALGLILFATLLGGADEHRHRLRLGVLFGAIWTCTAAVGWVGASWTGSVTVGAGLLLVVTACAGYAAYRRLLALDRMAGEWA